MSKQGDSRANACSAPEFANLRVAKSQSYRIKFVPIATGATRSIPPGKGQMRRSIRRLPMRGSFRVFADPQAALKRNCVTQVMVSLSALASTTVLLMKLVPTMLTGLQ